MFQRAARVNLPLYLFIAALACAAPTLAGPNIPKPPADLSNLEREVSLKIAHVRDVGSTDPADRKKLGDAQRLDAKAEKAIDSGDFRSAEDDLVKANALATELTH
ncbi:MAG: hypothetical protein ACYDC3_02565 [Candidatus Binataceae bacterium]